MKEARPQPREEKEREYSELRKVPVRGVSPIKEPINTNSAKRSILFYEQKLTFPRGKGICIETRKWTLLYGPGKGSSEGFVF